MVDNNMIYLPLYIHIKTESAQIIQILVHMWMFCCVLYSVFKLIHHVNSQIIVDIPYIFPRM